MYLGAKIDNLLNDTEEAAHIIFKTTKAMVSLKFIRDTAEVPLKTKNKSHETMPMDLVMWESRNWSGNKADM